MFKLTQKTLKNSLVLSILIFLFNCTDDSKEPTNGVDGSNGFNALVEVQNEESGENCATGGVRISVGQDANENGILDESEIASVSFVCNGADGSDGADGNPLVARTSAENPGENCENGGTLIEIGVDENENNILDNDEVQTSFYVCNGQDGSGSGNNGSDGLTSLIRATPIEGCGSNETTGIRIEIGLDTNGNGELDSDPNEVQTTYDLCDGSDGINGLNTLLSCSNERAGDNCVNGGIMVEIGLDRNDNGLLDEDEKIGEPKYICNGVDGEDGKSPIVTTSTDVSCTNGGIELTFGYDNDANGTIDEILEVITVCNGENGNDGSDGYNSIVKTSASTTCPNGGTFVEIGLDTNSNGILDDTEIEHSFDICNGSDGSNGLNSVVDISTFSGNAGSCNTNDGGIIIRVGIDDNSNGVLDIPGEVDQTQYICNGDDGSDGADGNSDGIFEFYFQEGFDSYTGVLDVSITDKNPTETGETLSVDRGTTDSHGLLLFPELEKLSDLVGEDFQIVEAILYLRGLSARIDGQSQGNWIGVKTLLSNAPLFEEDAVSWTTANSSGDDWTLSGVTSRSDDGDANGYSDMFQLPPTGNFEFDGYIPLKLNISDVTSWTDKDNGRSNNKGVVLIMADGGIQYELDIYTSSYSKDSNYRPLLYIKVKTGVSGRSSSLESFEFSKKWSSMTYEEKLAPLNGRLKD